MGINKKAALQKLDRQDDPILLAAGAKGALQSLNDPEVLEGLYGRVTDPEFRKSAASRLSRLLKDSDPERAEFYRSEAARQMSPGTR